MSEEAHTHAKAIALRHQNRQQQPKNKKKMKRRRRKAERERNSKLQAKSNPINKVHYMAKQYIYNIVRIIFKEKKTTTKKHGKEIIKRLW